MEFDFLSYREETTTVISYQNVIDHLNKHIPDVSINFNDKYRTNQFKIYIPHQSVNPVCYDCKITQNVYCFHDVRLYYPCSITDLKIFNCLTNYFQNAYEVNKYAFIYQKHSHYEKYFYSRIKALLNSTNLEIAWQNLMNSVFKKDKSCYEFTASNNVLNFILSAVFLNVNSDDKNFNENIVNAVLKYIWQNKFIEVNNTYNCMMLHHHSNKMRDSVIETNIWENNQTMFFNIHYYLLVKFNEEWIAIKPKNWLQILLPYLQKYDLGASRQLLPVIDNVNYLQILSTLSIYAVNLQFSQSKKDSKVNWTASVKNYLTRI